MSFIEFFSTFFLSGIALVLPACIILSVVQAIRAIKRPFVTSSAESAQPRNNDRYAAAICPSHERKFAAASFPYVVLTHSLLKKHVKHDLIK